MRDQGGLLPFVGIKVRALLAGPKLEYTECSVSDDWEADFHLKGKFMDIGRFSERMMGMDDATWMRHSNPLSGWSRVSILPLLSLAIWSRIWLGWHCIWVIAVVVIWTWMNPRVFGPPKSNDAWMTQGVLGERIWLARASHAIPYHHERVTRSLNFTAGLGAVVLALGLWKLDGGMTLAGLVTTMGAKLWFLDRMVWLKTDADREPLD